MIWAFTLIIGLIVGAGILFVGIAVGRYLGEAEATPTDVSWDEFGEDQRQ